MKRVLITGAGSYVGESVKKYILEKVREERLEKGTVIP
jgi:hypothetical protein